MAPHAKVYLVEAVSDGLTDLFAAVAGASQCAAVNGGGEVSMSWGFSEFASETAHYTFFTQKGVVYFAGAVDSPGVLYPSASPNVVSVGGTSLVGNPLSWRGTLGDFGGEVVWNWGPSGGTGGGPSAYEPRPPYQFLIKNMVGSSRGTPDSPPSPTPLPGCGSTTRNLSVGAPSVEPTFPLRYGRASSTRRVGSTTPRWPSTPKSTRAHPCSRKVLECLRTLPPAPAVSDPTSRASWPPKAETSAPGWAARSVISGSKPSQGPPSR